ncbi:MAG: rRNA pseudouridine synthase [Alphaproteobacteria bacterium]|nr:rRNA pseudouridine synthase [Alphaproteobacteria bacterium]
MASGIFGQRRGCKNFCRLRCRRRRTVTQDTAPKAASGERLAKRIARAGLCSRREAERWIEAGRVCIDGKQIESPAINVTERQRITVDGKDLPAADRTRLWRYHKPKGLVTTHRDPQGRPTVFEHLPPGLPRVVSVGRLDLNSEGLLLLTNDGELARRLEQPASGWRRHYRVRAFGTADPVALDRLVGGITVDGVCYGSIQVKVERQQGANVWLSVSLAEGKNREVRKVLEHLGLKVSRLIRVAYGPFQLGRLPKEGVAEVPGKVIGDALGARKKKKA